METRYVPNNRHPRPRAGLALLAVPAGPPRATVLVDGSNAAFLTSPKVNGRRQAKYATLAQVLDYLAGLRVEFPGVATEVLVDANLPYHVDDRASLAADIDAGAVQLCPAGVQADAFLLEYARACPGRALVVSNDLFRGHAPLAKEQGGQWRFPLMVIQGQVVVPRLRDELAARHKAGFQSSTALTSRTGAAAGHF